jgi:hypothetical protein
MARKYQFRLAKFIKTVEYLVRAVRVQPVRQMESDLNFTKLMANGKEKRLTVILVEAKSEGPEKLNRVYSGLKESQKRPFLRQTKSVSKVTVFETV